MTAVQRRPKAWIWLRYGVSAAALFALLWLIPLRTLARALTQASPLVLLSSLAVLLSGHVIAALKWRLLQGVDVELSIDAAVRAHFSGIVANLWLPGVVGGDVVRAGIVLGGLERPATVVVASIVDRAIDSVGLLTLAVIGLLLNPAFSLGWTVVAGIAGAAAALGIVSVIAYAALKKRTTARTVRVIEAVQLIVAHPQRVAAAFAISLGVQTAFILVNVSLGRSVGMAAPSSVWFMAWPLAKLAALAPISAAGLGVREAAFVALMRPFGDPAAVIMAAGLLWQAVFLAGGILGWVAAALITGDAQLRRKPSPTSSTELRS